jgi:hypothetical protein
MVYIIYQYSFLTNPLLFINTRPNFQYYMNYKLKICLYRNHEFEE